MNGQIELSRLPRVLYLALEAPHEGQAAYAHVNEIIQGLRRLGHEVILFTPHYASGNERPRVVGRLVEYVRLQWRLIRELRRGDVLYVRSHFLAAMASAYARVAEIAVVQEINGPYEDLFISYPWTRRLGRPLIWLQRWQFSMADALISVTPQLKDWVLGQIGPADVEVVPNGANAELFRPDAPPSIDGLPGKFVVFFGGFARWQGIETMISAIEVPEWPSDTCLVVVGDGMERDAIAAAAARNPRLKWLGRLDYVKVAGVVARSIGGLIPKNRQGDRDGTGLFPVKLFETLACGVPAIVSDFPGQADLIRANDCGVVIPPENPKALAEAVARLSADPAAAQTMGARGAELVRRDHSWQRRAEQTAAVITRVTKRPS